MIVPSYIRYPEVINAIVDLASQPGFKLVVLSGSAGTGKTFITNMVEHTLTEKKAPVEFYYLHKLVNNETTIPNDNSSSTIVVMYECINPDALYENIRKGRFDKYNMFIVCILGTAWKPQLRNEYHFDLDVLSRAPELVQ
jgi:hypothetical protein